MQGTGTRFFTSAFISAILWTATSSIAFADICKQDKAGIYDSPDCIRYLFECTVTDTQEFEDLPLESRQRRKYAKVAAEAARECKHFSYKEAEAAFLLKLLWLGN